jgi:hypothetical protein
MTGHAIGNAGNASVRSLVHAHVAVFAFQPILEMDGVCVGDRLDRMLRMKV